MADTLYATVTGCSDIEAVNVSDSHGAATATATVLCGECTAEIGDSVSIDLGYSDNHSVQFTGYVKTKQESQSPGKTEMTAYSSMTRAVDYFIVSDTPDNPYTRENISAETLIGELMQMAGLTDYYGGTSTFTFATRGTPVEVNLVSVYDYSKFIADLLAWHVYATVSGQIRFVSRPQFPQETDPSVATLENANIITVGYLTSDRDIRNRVVVYGREGVSATAQASSPYLPPGFYKTAAVSAPTVIDTQEMAQQSANYNLAKLNRLTIGGTISVIGNPAVHCRDCVTVSKSDIGMSGKFYVFGCEHDWSSGGYMLNLDLRQ